MKNSMFTLNPIYTPTMNAWYVKNNDASFNDHIFDKVEGKKEN